MSFLDNGSADILVDAVLTDVGRQRLAQGGGRFNVTKFALADDEIDYRLYNGLDPSGSAYYDLNILQAPVLEPSTNSVASCRSKLFTYYDQNLYYLPTLLLNQDSNVKDGPITIIDTDTNSFDLIASDNFANLINTQIKTSYALIDGRVNIPTNITNTLLTSNVESSQLIRRFLRVSQGFDNYQSNIELGGLEERSFSIHVNKLFLQVVDKTLVSSQSPSITTNVFNRTQAVDVYFVSADNNAFFGDIQTYNDGIQTKLATSLRASSLAQVGKELQFSLRVSQDLASNPSYYFTTFGSLFSGTVAGKAITAADGVYMISTTVRVMGNTYGFSLDIPVKLFYK